eukprot:TRINITY_DN19195_c0_g2_i1.p1 TRINITY_DN19195_c0_g2~~TRINITY_DN19195_c0_g2_i1.p1  ORF type:complete len:795 (+),score=182.23 TRINITY_DN19195_c0_g2_i1:73-2457(+)
MSTKTEAKPGLILETIPEGGEKTLVFHNELRDKMFRCSYGFKGGSVRALGSTSEKDGKYVVNVYPGESSRFVTGTWTGMSKSHGSGEPDKSWKDKQANESKDATDTDVQFVMELLKKSGKKTVTAQHIADECAAHGVRFVDLNFPPKDASLKPDWIKRIIQLYPWKRPALYLQGTGLKPTLFVDKIEPNDIDQGALADCYLMGALASVAEFEHLVRSMFEDQQDPELGCYRITLCKNGWWQTVIVDDFLPCSGSKPAFARNREEPNELWVCLVEKAYAKLHGSYAAIQTGSCTRAMSDLTGCPARLFDLKEDMWQTLLDNDNKEFLQILGTPGKNLMNVPEDLHTVAEKAMWDKYQSVGLITEHSYSLITVKLTKDGHKLCMIRNPWGNDKEWKGKWSDSDKSWTPAMKKECGFVAQDDGSFWMEWADVVKWFNQVSVCYTYGSWDQIHIAGNYNSGVTDIVAKITVSRKQKCWFAVYQKDPRGVPKGHPDSELDAIEMWIPTVVNGATSKPAGRKSSSQRELYLEITLSPGTEYYLLAQPKEAKLSKSMVCSLFVEDKDAAEITFATPVKPKRYDTPEKFSAADWKATQANYQIKGQFSTNGCVVNRTGKTVDFGGAKDDVSTTTMKLAKKRADAEDKRRKGEVKSAGTVAPVSAAAVQIKVTLYSGSDLISMDSNGLSDPFCEVKLREIKDGRVGASHPNPQKKVSKVIPKTLNPEWRESFTFLVPSSDCVRVSIFDKDLIGKDNMGRIDLKMPDLVPKLTVGKELKSSYKVQAIAASDKVSGSCMIGVTLL